MPGLAHGKKRNSPSIASSRIGWAVIFCAVFSCMFACNERTPAEMCRQRSSDTGDTGNGGATSTDSGAVAQYVGRTTTDAANTTMDAGRNDGEVCRPSQCRTEKHMANCNRNWPRNDVPKLPRGE